MSFYRICEYCGVALDPGEKCECRKEIDAAFHGENKNRLPAKPYREAVKVTPLNNRVVHAV